MTANPTARSHRLAWAVMTAPGVALAMFALAADVLRGGDFAADWGTGQSLLLAAGLLAVATATLIHRKACQDEQRGKRRYGRTLAFIAIPLVLLVAVPLIGAELLARWIPEADDTGTSYRRTDPEFGFLVAPDREFHVVSRPKAFDIRVRTDANGFRIGPQGRVAIESADVLVLGDSHPFGFGVAEAETLTEHLAKHLREREQPHAVINAGVPGFGLGQSWLRLRRLEPALRRGALVVLFINPMNDLVNLSSAVDYHYPKPHPVLRGDQVEFQPAPVDWGEGAFLFSEPFDSLNAHFGLADRRKPYHSALLRRLSATAVQPPTIDGVTELIDQTAPGQYIADDANRIAAEPMVYASRFWPEMPRWNSERKKLSQLATAVLRGMQQTCTKNDWRLVAIVAPEAYAHQRYSRNFLRQVQAVVPDTPVEIGWSRKTILEACRDAAIVTVTPDYSGAEVESLFVQNDDHTSGLGHALIASAVVDRWFEEGWIP